MDVINERKTDMIGEQLNEIGAKVGAEPASNNLYSAKLDAIIEAMGGTVPESNLISAKLDAILAVAGGGGNKKLNVVLSGTGEPIDYVDNEIKSIRESAISKNTFNSITSNSLERIEANAFTPTADIKFINAPNLLYLGEYNIEGNIKSMTSLDFPMLKTVGGIGGAGNNSIKYVRFGSKSELPLNTVSTSGTQASLFRYANALEYADIGNLSAFYGTSFRTVSGSKLKVLILRKSTVIPYANTSADATYDIVNAKIYVPASLVEEYKVATNWSRHSSRIFAIEGSPYEDSDAAWENVIANGVTV